MVNDFVNSVWMLGMHEVASGRPHSFTLLVKCGSSSIGRAAAFQAAGCEFDARLPLSIGRCSSVVEYFLGKEGVTGSNPVIGSANGSLGWQASLSDYSICQNPVHRIELL